MPRSPPKKENKGEGLREKEHLTFGEEPLEGRWRTIRPRLGVKEERLKKRGKGAWENPELPQHPRQKTFN